MTIGIDIDSTITSTGKKAIECLKFGQKSNKYKTFNNWFDIIEYIKTK